MQSFTVGQLAKRAGVNIETLRYYEKRRLMPKPSRSESGYRQYTDCDVARLLFIKRAKELGFSLKEILELLFLRVDPETTCADVKKQAKLKLIDVENKIQALMRIKKALSVLEAICSGAGPTNECPILESLNIKE